MPLRKIGLLAVFCFGLLLSAPTAHSNESGTGVKWKSVPPGSSLPSSRVLILVDVTLSSGIEVKGIRYENLNYSDEWILQLKNFLGTQIVTRDREEVSLSLKDLDELFEKLFYFVETNYNGQLDRILFGFGFIDAVWVDIVLFLRSGILPPDYELKRKDLDLGIKIGAHLVKNPILDSLCEKAMQIRKVCKNRDADVNPITYEREHIGKEWRDVADLPDVGIPKIDFWYDLSLVDKAP